MNRWTCRVAKCDTFGGRDRTPQLPRGTPISARRHELRRAAHKLNNGTFVVKTGTYYPAGVRLTEFDHKYPSVIALGAFQQSNVWRHPRERDVMCLPHGQQSTVVGDSLNSLTEVRRLGSQHVQRGRVKLIHNAQD